jgi:hypothetical protein
MHSFMSCKLLVCPTRSDILTTGSLLGAYWEPSRGAVSRLHEMHALPKTNEYPIVSTHSVPVEY